MKPFNLGSAVAGDPFVLVLSSECDTIPVRFIGELTDHRIVVERRAESGVYYVEVCPEARLRMAPKKKTVWVNLWRDLRPSAINACHYEYYESEAHAKDAASKYLVSQYPLLARAVPVEIEID